MRPERVFTRTEGPLWQNMETTVFWRALKFARLATGTGREAAEVGTVVFYLKRIIALFGCALPSALAPSMNE